MTVLARYPDAELVALDLLAGLGNTVTTTDQDILDGTILIQRVGGADDGITDKPVLMVTCFHSDRQNAWLLARTVQQRILAAGCTVVTGEFVTGVLIDAARTVTPPDQLPDRNADLRPVAAQYQLGLRRPR